MAAGSAGKAIADPIQNGIDPRLLSVSLTLAFFTIVSLRALLDVPSDRNASWVFRSTVDRHRHEAQRGGGKSDDFSRHCFSGYRIATAHDVLGMDHQHCCIPLMS